MPKGAVSSLLSCRHEGCMLYMADKDQATEVLNNAFFTFFLHPHRYEAYIPFQVTLNHLIITSIIQRYAHNRSTKNGIKEDYYLDDGEPDVDIDFHSLSELPYEELFHLLKSLPAPYRIVYNLFIIDHYSNEDISDLLSIPVTSSEMRLQKARALLEKMMKQFI